MATIHEKLARLENAKALVEELLGRGVDLRATEAVPFGLEFVHACDDLAQEFGFQILKPIDKKDNFIRPDPTTKG